MPDAQTSRMTLPARVQTSNWLPLAAIFVALIVLVMMGVDGVQVPRGVPLAGSGTLVHWQDASHDWLLVGDGQGDQLTVYSAVDGRMLRRIPVKQGLGRANALAQRDGRLFVVGDNGQVGVLSLPQLTLVASNTP